MTLNTISISEKPESVKREGWWNVLQNNAKISPAVKALWEGNIKLYIKELMQSGRFPQNMNTKDFSDEVWAILEYSANILSRNPDINTTRNCLDYIGKLLWDTDEARRIAEIIMIWMFSDAQRVKNLWFNIVENDGSHLKQLLIEKQKYSKELQDLLPNAINIENLYIKDMRILIEKIKLDENLKTVYDKMDFSELSHKI